MVVENFFFLHDCTWHLAFEAGQEDAALARLKKHLSWVVQGGKETYYSVKETYYSVKRDLVQCKRDISKSTSRGLCTGDVTLAPGVGKRGARTRRCSRAAAAV